MMQRLSDFTWYELLSYTGQLHDSQGSVYDVGPNNPFKGRPLFVAWLRDCQFRAREENSLLAKVMSSFQALKGEVLPPEGIQEAVITTPEPKPVFIPPKFSWAYSSLTNFESCPFQYAAKYFYKTLRYESSPEAEYGTKVHLALEMACQNKASKEQLQLLEQNGWMKYVTAIQSSPGEKYFELELALDEKWKPTTWKKGTGRLKGDVVIINGDKANYFDWKTGKEKDEQYQLRLACLFLALKYPQVKTFNARFVWLMTDKVVPLEKPFDRKELFAVYEETQARIKRVKESWASRVFPANKNGLCKKWCKVTNCAHCGK